MPIDYNQLEHRMAAVLQGKPYPVVRMKNGCGCPWGSEYVLEGRIIPRKREAEGPFGEFTGHYSGGRNMPTIEIDRVFHRKDPVFEHLYLGQPWTEIDYLLSICTRAAMYAHMQQTFPEVDRSRVPTQGPGVRTPLPGPALDGDRLPALHLHLRGDVRTAEADLPGSRRGQRHLHSRPGRHRIDQGPGRRLRQGRRAARLQHAAWPRPRQGRHRRG